MSSSANPHLELPISASALLSDVSVLPPRIGAQCELTRVVLRDGLDLLVWRGQAAEPMTMNLHDDSDRVHFSYSLQGYSQSSFDDGPARNCAHVLREGHGCINYNPGRRGRFEQHGKFESVTVSAQPEFINTWVPEMDAALKNQLKAGHCYSQCRCSAEMRATAQALSRALQIRQMSPADESNRALLWLLGQSLVLVSLVLEARDAPDHSCGELTMTDRQKLLRARDRLLADLSRAPTIAELAKEVNLSVLKLKRGFRQLFNNSIYGLFQQERMQEARRRLSLDVPVMVVAADLGYTNASHFAVAFQKQFGVNPSALKRRQ